MGKHKAPAIKKPHIECAKQVKMCVSHAKKHAHPSMYPISTFQSCFCVPKLPERVEHVPCTLKLFLSPFFDLNEAGLGDRDKHVCAPSVWDV